MQTVGANFTGWADIADRARYLILPASTLGLFYMGAYARLTRRAMLEVAGQDFIKTARAKGVAEGRILRRHVLRNALLPVVTLAGIQAGQLIGGSVLVETVFAWPGIGRLRVAAQICDRVAVMQRGMIVEQGRTDRGVRSARPRLHTGADRQHPRPVDVAAGEPAAIVCRQRVSEFAQA